MAGLKWYMNRIKVMNTKEVLWRLQQKNIQKKEKNIFKENKILVTNLIFSNELNGLILDGNRLGINFKNKNHTIDSEISLFELYDYGDYKKNWHAGFQTKNKWPLEFSYDLVHKQRVDIGDVRTNWELNRHFQFELLAKKYYISKEKKYLIELIDLFEDWNQKNPFLHGVSWTSVMEVAIRINSWIFCYTFLKESKDVPDKLLNELTTGIINMTDYVAKHYSRYSSANNHVIVEAYAIGLSGMVFDYKPWINTAINILDTEFVIQNYSDGINKELSLHYQTFVMEAMGLLIRNMKINDIKIPDKWINTLEKMSRYVSNCIGKYGEVIAFGDNDEGKILDLQGGKIDHYRYVLEMMSLLVTERYIDLSEINETISWLFSQEFIQESQKKKLYDTSKSICYKEGGNTILKSTDGRILIGIDHAALGYGSLAAHGHADALSFQMYVDGKPVLVDPGTYNYHFSPEDRNYYRKTINHNTITINNKDQSEILGPFMWGRKANSILNKVDLTEEYDFIKISHDGYSPIIHNREIFFNKKNEFKLKDAITEVNQKISISNNFLLGPEFYIESINRNNVVVMNNDIRVNFNFSSENKFVIKECQGYYSSVYSKKVKITSINVKYDISKDNLFETIVRIEEINPNRAIEEL